MKKQLHKERYRQQFVFEIESNKDFKAGEKIFWLKGPSQFNTFNITSTESQTNVISNKFSWDESQINVISNKFSWDESINKFRISLDEFKFKLDGLLETVRGTRTESQTNTSADEFNLEGLHAYPLVHSSCKFCPLLPQDDQKLRCTSSACPGKKIMKSESLNIDNLHAVHSSEGLNRDSSGPLGKLP